MPEETAGNVPEGQEPTDNNPISFEGIMPVANPESQTTDNGPNTNPNQPAQSDQPDEEPPVPPNIDLGYN